MWLTDFSTLLGSAASSPPLEITTIILGTFILEDAATLLAAMQVASGAVALPLALGSLYAGIVLGDLGLYGLGRLSAKHPWAQRMVPKRRRDLGRDWVSQRVIPIVLVSRFVPGLRLPTYTTCGFLKAPFLTFAAAAIMATLAWTSLLFFISLKLGALMLHYLGPYRWVGLAVFVLLLIVVGRIIARWQSDKIGKDG
ncbi:MULTISPECIES: DedA family protein [Acidiphilium]|uniref:Membrane protein DedA, SNARE-associated domain n=1 Tax=Acidiphilium rubrum TaxID=526 RepID=A0A8G2CMZ6_ACIRU|nr:MULTISPECIES: VTT domain-containing protein [Acidiphilium]SIR33865.1 membrane protein DedA, SNARE-associated domain [Acidiphilium rubrum]